jgi:hypothetical protein
LNDFIEFGNFFKYKAPAVAKTICVAARSTITIGNPASKNPNEVPNATNTAVAGDINIAINIATWLASVNDAGSIVILIGEIIGITIPIEHRSADINIALRLLFLFIDIPPNKCLVMCLDT